MHKAIRARTASWVIPMLLTAVAALFVVVACGGSSSTAGGSSTTAGGADTGTATTPNTIMIKNFKYAPVEITVSPGAKITVMNQDTAAHTVTAGDKSFDTGNIAPGQTGQLTAPSKPGSYPYVCTIHPYMAGTLVVK